MKLKMASQLEGKEIEITFPLYIKNEYAAELGATVWVYRIEQSGIRYAITKRYEYNAPQDVAEYEFSIDHIYIKTALVEILSGEYAGKIVASDEYAILLEEAKAKLAEFPDAAE